MDPKKKYVTFGELKKLDEYKARESKKATRNSAQNPVPIEPRSNRTGFSEPRSIRTPFPQNPVHLTPSGSVNVNSLPGFRIPNFVEDEILPTLDPYAQSIFRRLLRLSIGFNRQETDPVTIAKLCEKCNLSEAAAKRAVKVLQERKLISVKVNGDGSRSGNQYTVLPDIKIEGFNQERGSNRTGFSQTPNNHDDHDFKKNNHDHQKDFDRKPIPDDHREAVTALYQTVTSNQWRSSDDTAYETIKHIPYDEIEKSLKHVHARAKNRPNSLSYFTKEILRNHDVGSPTNIQHLDRLIQIGMRVRLSLIGRPDPPLSELKEAIKTQAAAESIPCHPAVLDQVLDRLEKGDF